jgi:hypothetical protein
LSKIPHWISHVQCVFDNRNPVCYGIYLPCTREEGFAKSLLLCSSLLVNYGFSSHDKKTCEESSADEKKEKNKKKRKHANLDLDAILAGFWFLVSPWPLFLDQLAEAGGVRGALILSAIWELFPLRLFVCCLSHTTIIDSASSKFS